MLNFTLYVLVYVIGMIVIGLPLAKMSVEVYLKMLRMEKSGLLGFLLRPLNWMNVSSGCHPTTPLSIEILDLDLFGYGTDQWSKSREKGLREYFGTYALFWVPIIILNTISIGIITFSESLWYLLFGLRKLVRYLASGVSCLIR